MIPFNLSQGKKTIILENGLAKDTEARTAEQTPYRAHKKKNAFLKQLTVHFLERTNPNETVAAQNAAQICCVCCFMNK